MDEKRVFHTLDGLRGVAAICVALHHLSRWPIGLQDPMPQAGLAVDMFFVMSGFVLAHAYQHRLDAGMTTWRFMGARLIRLWPLYLLGTAIKLAAILYLSGHGAPAPGSAIVSSILFALVLLPVPRPLSITGQPFPLNAPAWSLFFELGVNFVWATVLRRSHPRILACICVVAAAALVIFSGTFETFISGLPRVGFSFFAGILSYGAWKRWPANWRLGPWAAPLVLAAAVALFAAPVSTAATPAYQLACMALFPVFVWASAKVSARGWIASAMKQLGIASYALYVLHDPVFFLVMRAGTLPTPLHLPGPYMALLVLAPLIGLTLFLNMVFDRPARKWLTGALAPTPAASA
jgi:peptidoglycan/LPS O-acetylase OafA/YrhL